MKDWETIRAFGKVTRHRSLAAPFKHIVANNSNRKTVPVIHLFGYFTGRTDVPADLSDLSDGQVTATLVRVTRTRRRDRPEDRGALEKLKKVKHRHRFWAPVLEQAARGAAIGRDHDRGFAVRPCRKQQDRECADRRYVLGFAFEEDAT